jgi:hypothetical protein
VGFASEILSDTAVTTFGNPNVAAFCNAWAILERNSTVI